MPITNVANSYLEALEHDGDLEGGLSFREVLSHANLDFSRASLSRIDALLDQIRAQHKPEYNDFIDEQSNVNFLYVLAFYIGQVIATQAGANIEWYGYEEMIERNPGKEGLLPDCFTTSVTCSFSGGSHDTRLFIPLTAVESRLYDEEPDKSVAYSASAFM